MTRNCGSVWGVLLAGDGDQWVRDLAGPRIRLTQVTHPAVLWLPWLIVQCGVPAAWALTLVNLVACGVTTVALWQAVGPIALLYPCAAGTFFVLGENHHQAVCFATLAWLGGPWAGVWAACAVLSRLDMGVPMLVLALRTPAILPLGCLVGALGAAVAGHVRRDGPRAWVNEMRGQFCPQEVRRQHPWLQVLKAHVRVLWVGADGWRGHTTRDCWYFGATLVGIGLVGSLWAWHPWELAWLGASILLFHRWYAPASEEFYLASLPPVILSLTDGAPWLLLLLTGLMSICGVWRPWVWYSRYMERGALTLGPGNALRVSCESGWDRVLGREPWMRLKGRMRRTETFQEIQTELAMVTGPVVAYHLVPTPLALQGINDGRMQRGWTPLHQTDFEAFEAWVAHRALGHTWLPDDADGPLYQLRHATMRLFWVAP